MPGMVYQWKEQARVPIPAQVAGEAIERLRGKDKRQVTPAQVVEAARPRKSPLHPAFEWDDSVAAERYRQDQARYMLRSLVTLVEPTPGEPVEVRAFVTFEAKEAPGYMPVTVVMADGKLRRLVVERAWAELREWQRRYRAYDELADVMVAIDAAGATRGSRGERPRGDA